MPRRTRPLEREPLPAAVLATLSPEPPAVPGHCLVEFKQEGWLTWHTKAGGKIPQLVKKGYKINAFVIPSPTVPNCWCVRKKGKMTVVPCNIVSITL